MERMPEVEWSTDVRQVGWIRRRLGPFESGEVTSVVPAGFEAYARVLHPAHGAEERAIRWSEVAARNGIELRRDTHFPEIALLPPGDGNQAWDVVGPQEGTLCAADATALVDILRQHTASPDQCWFCLWDGYGWDSTAPYSMSFPLSDDQPSPRAVAGVYDGPDVDVHMPEPLGAPEDPIPHEVRDGPRVEMPEREYFLYKGELDAALAFVETQQQTPNLWWPADRTWCLASEMDLPWTYIGGPSHLIDHLVGDSRIEAWQAEPTDNHQLRLPLWLSAAVDGEVSLVLQGYPGRVQTQLGTVTVTVRRPRRLRHGDLWTTSVRSDGSSDGSSWTRLTDRNENALREEIRHALAWAVVDLLG